MVKKAIPVNSKSNDFATIGGRLVAERELRKIKQVDLCVRLGVSKTTQIKYESNQSFPDVRYLADLYDLGFDVLYILTGDRSTEALKPEHQNLIEAYEDAPLAVKIAAFGMLLTAYHPFRSHIDNAMNIPGFNRYELAMEDDVRYQRYHDEKRRKDDEAASPMDKASNE